MQKYKQAKCDNQRPQKIPEWRDCWICFSNENNTTLTLVDSEKTLKNCKTYLDPAIIIKSFENEAGVSCCRYCYETAHQLTVLEEQVQKIQKEISDLSFLFSKNVLERRSGSNTTKYENGNQTPECFLFNKKSDDHQILEFENVGVKKEANECESKELTSDSQMKTGRDKNIIVIALWLDSQSAECEKVANHISENVNHSEDNIDVKYSYDETVSEVVGNFMPNIAPNQQLPETSSLCDPQTIKTSMSDLLKCLKTPIIQLERIQLCRSRSTAKIVCDIVDENIKHEQVLEDSSEPINCSETLSKELPFKCDEISCPESFISKDALVKHQTIHSLEKPHKCSICSKSFSKLVKLKSHEKFHSREKRFKCSFCSRSFKVSIHLKDHERIHSGEKPFKCSLCSKSFRRSDMLKEHKRVHSGERPYKCHESSCLKSFISRSVLNKHLKVHSEERLYKCSVCSKSYKQASHLKSHKKTHSGGTPYNCSNCEKTFKTKPNLTEHRKRMQEEYTEEFILS